MSHQQVSEPRWPEGDKEVKLGYLSSETIMLLNVVVQQHDCCVNPDFEIRYSFGSAIGTNIVAKCTRCGQRFDVTDYGNW